MGGDKRKGAKRRRDIEKGEERPFSPSLNWEKERKIFFEGRGRKDGSRK